MTITAPSSKWITSTAVSSLTLIVVMITASQDQGVALPQWLMLVGAVLGPILTYAKAENRPSESGRKAALESTTS